jgi:hypothetical protein
MIACTPADHSSYRYRFFRVGGLALGPAAHSYYSEVEPAAAATEQFWRKAAYN